MKTPKVFISYCWSPAEHKEKVLEFAEELGKRNVKVRIDAYKENELVIWNEWCEAEIKMADYVLVICNKEYYRRFEKLAPRGEGKGVKWEGYIIKRTIFEEEGNCKFVPIAFNEIDWNYRPKILSVTNSFLINNEESFKDLCRLLFNKPKYSPPEPTNFDPDKELEPRIPKDFFPKVNKVIKKQEDNLQTYLNYIRTNSYGYEEYLWEIDKSILIKIPKGKFLCGNMKQKFIELDEFFIDKYCITNEQFKTFVSKENYITEAEKNDIATVADLNKTWKKEKGKNWMSFNNEKTKNHPVVMITPNDAIAYCNWAKKRLPSSLEWEKAARGESGQIYPWGNDFNYELPFANFGLIRKGTQPVDSYPYGASPYGCMNMAGNVWEWSLASEDSKDFGQRTAKTKDELSSRLSYVNRGGSWFDEEFALRCYYGEIDEPGAFFHLGFRSVLSFNNENSE